MATTASISQRGERYATSILEARGYEVIALQTASGHGIDIVAIKQKFGRTLLLVVEVKTAGGSLSEAQQNLGGWAKNRLERAIAGSGHYRSISKEAKARAQKFNALIESGTPAAALVVAVRKVSGKWVARITGITRVPPAGKLARPLTRRRFRGRR